METQKSERAARLAMLESAIRFAAASPGTDFSHDEDEDEDEGFDPIRNIEPDADRELKEKRNLFLASW